MTIIYLVRHGQASFSSENYDQLSDKGILQASLVGQYLQKKIARPSAVITGDMNRHKQTAQHSIKAFNLNSDDNDIVIEDARWNEYDHQNILGMYNTELATPSSTRRYLAKQEQSLQMFKALFINAINQWSHAEDASGYTESFAHFSERVIAALKEVAEKHTGGKVIIYTSGGPISLIICYLLGLPLTQFIDINWSLVNGGVTKLITRGQSNQLTLSTMNEHDVFEQCTDKRLITYT
ncbi:histidine phosphatase family protein [Thalassotalea piscium]